MYCSDLAWNVHQRHIAFPDHQTWRLHINRASFLGLLQAPWRAKHHSHFTDEVQEAPKTSDHIPLKPLAELPSLCLAELTGAQLQS